MFDRLIESHPGREQNAGQALGSALLHLVVIAAAVQVTRGSAEVAEKPPLPKAAFAVLPPAPPAVVVRTAPVAATTASTSSAPAFQAIVAPTIVSLSIPPVDLNTGVIDPSRIPVNGTIGAALPPGILAGGDLSTRLSSEAFSSEQVESPAALLKWEAPKYPPALKAAGIVGQVTLEFVVGTDGRAEASTVKVVSSSSTRFEDAAIESVKGASYRPAQLHRQNVRQLVVQRINFVIDG